MRTVPAVPVASLRAEVRHHDARKARQVYTSAY
jgi:hypothetical protein